MSNSIKQPRNVVLRGPNGTKAELKFNPNFAPKYTRRYSVAQKQVDQDVLNYSARFIPFKTGSLNKSGITGTDVGSGKVSWIAPYAKRQYYFGRLPGQNKLEPLRGRHWFARMKEVFGKTIIATAKKLVGKG